MLFVIRFQNIHLSKNVFILLIINYIKYQKQKLTEKLMKERIFFFMKNASEEFQIHHYKYISQKILIIFDSHELSSNNLNVILIRETYIELFLII